MQLEAQTSPDIDQIEKDETKPVRDQFLVFGAPDIQQAEIDEIVDTLKSGWLGTGPKTHQFEADFARYTRAQHAIGLNSCTAGMHLALDLLDLQPGDEVITTAMTFVATANVVVHHHAKPVFVDVQRDTFNIDPALVEAAITPRTRAIMPVDMCGRPVELEKIMEIARRHNLTVIEDAAHATESVRQGQKIGSIADITAFSFYVTKNMTTGEGGMVTTNNDDWAAEMRVRSLHGLSRDAWKRYSAAGFQPYDCAYPGYKYNMTDMQASLGLHQLARLDNNLHIREKLWAYYDVAFADVEEITIPAPVASGDVHARHLYTILLNLEMLDITRNEFIDLLKHENVGSGIHFTPVHLHSFYQKEFGCKPGDFPNAEFIGERTLSLPFSTKISEQDAADVVEAVRRIVKRHRR